MLGNKVRYRSKRHARAVLITLGIIGLMQSKLGPQWTEVSKPGGPCITSLAVIGTRIFAGTRNHGIYLSQDGGSHWSPMNSGLPEGGSVKHLAMKGTDIFASIGGIAWKWWGGDLYRSKNYGRKWTRVARQIQFGAVFANGKDLLAGGVTSTIFLSKDGGSTWRIQQGFNRDTNGLVGGRVEETATSFAAAGPYIFVSFIHAGIGRSSDNGKTFDWVTPELPEETAFECLTSIGTSICAGTSKGVFQSSDGGENWRPASSGLPEETEVRSFGRRGDNIFAGTSKGVYLSTDGGVSWKAVNSGLTNTLVNCIAVREAEIFVGTQGGGIFVSRNDGSSWTSVHSGLPKDASGLQLAAAGDSLFASTLGGGVFLSKDKGKSWYPVNSGLRSTGVSCLRVEGMYICAGTNDARVFISENNGDSWNAVDSKLHPDLPYEREPAVTSLAICGNRIIAGTSDEGVFLSENRRDMWKASKLREFPNYSVRCISEVGNGIYAGTDYDLFLSLDGGLIWKSVNLASPRVDSIVDVNCVTMSGRNQLVGWGYYFEENGDDKRYHEGGVLISSDDGVSWRPADAGMHPETAVFCFARSASRVYAGTSRGVFMSSDDGESWTKINEGLPSKALVKSLVTTGSELFAGIEESAKSYAYFADSRVWRIPLPGNAAGKFDK